MGYCHETKTISHPVLCVLWPWCRVMYCRCPDSTVYISEFIEYVGHSAFIWQQERSREREQHATHWTGTPVATVTLCAGHPKAQHNRSLRKNTQNIKPHADKGFKFFHVLSQSSLKWSEINIQPGGLKLHLLQHSDFLWVHQRTQVIFSPPSQCQRHTGIKSVQKTNGAILTWHS